MSPSSLLSLVDPLLAPSWGTDSSGERGAQLRESVPLLRAHPQAAWESQAAPPEADLIEDSQTPPGCHHRGPPACVALVRPCECRSPLGAVLWSPPPNKGQLGARVACVARVGSGLQLREEGS